MLCRLEVNVLDSLGYCNEEFDCFLQLAKFKKIVPV